MERYSEQLVEADGTGQRCWLMGRQEDGVYVKYDDAQRALDAEQERVRQNLLTIMDLQAQLADRDAMILQMGEQAAVLAKENMAVKAQLREWNDACEMMTHTAGTFQELWRGACDQREAMEAQLRQVEEERDALKLVNETHMKTVMKLSSIIEKSSTLAHDAGKGA